MTHIPTREQYAAATETGKILSTAIVLAGDCFSPVGDVARRDAPRFLQYLASTLGYTLQSPDDGAREKALVEALEWYADYDPEAVEQIRGYAARTPAAATLDYTLQSPEDVAREKALVEAGKPLVEGLEDLPGTATSRTWVYIRDLQALRKALAAYDPPAIISTPGAPHDGRAQPRGKGLLLAEEEEFVREKE